MASINTVPRAVWLVHFACVCTVVLCLGHMQITALTDTVGFSSNRDFYYATLHPIRTTVRMGLLIVGLGGIVICMALLGRHGHQSVLRAILVLSGVCAGSVCFGALLLITVMVPAMMRGEVALIEVLLAAAFLVPSLLGVIVALRLFRKTVPTFDRRLPLLSLVLLGLQAALLAQEGIRVFFPTLMVTCSALSLGFVVWLLAVAPDCRSSG